MNRPLLAFTAVFLKSNGGYFAFIEELPTVNAYGRSLGEARESLYKLAELALSDETLQGTGVVRENLTLPLPAPGRRRANLAA